MKRILTSQISLYWVALILIFISVATVFFARYYRDAVYDYRIQVSGNGSGVDEFKFGSWPALSNAQFFEEVKEKMIQERTNFIEADLSAMKLRMYSEGKQAGEVNILTKGKPGSWWETPAGLYGIRLKRDNMFSGFGKVYMPWSMQFQGNFFIHGWPYYPDGTPVASTYSGGCIRLSTEDAKKVYEWAKVGTPILVYEKDFGVDDFKYREKGPAVRGESYLVADLHNNFVFTSGNASATLPIASLTKLMTALVSTEYINLDKKITITSDMIVNTTVPRLREGQEIAAFQLLYPLLQESSNEAAIALSRFVGQERFVQLMNDKAKALGMSHTNFADPAGMSSQNISTAEDIFNLAKYLYNNRSFILKVSSGKLANSAYGPSEFSDLRNLNIFMEDPDFVGGKVGQLDASQQSILSVFELPVGEAKRPVAIIVLGTGDNASDAVALLRYVKGNFVQAFTDIGQASDGLTGVQ